jgi:hypothetical protein
MFRCRDSEHFTLDLEHDCGRKADMDSRDDPILSLLEYCLCERNEQVEITREARPLDRHRGKTHLYGAIIEIHATCACCKSVARISFDFEREFISFDPVASY